MGLAKKGKAGTCGLRFIRLLMDVLVWRWQFLALLKVFLGIISIYFLFFLGFLSKSTMLMVFFGGFGSNPNGFSDVFMVLVVVLVTF